MRILFCNIAWMKEYRLIFEKNIAVNGPNILYNGDADC